MHCQAMFVHLVHTESDVDALIQLIVNSIRVDGTRGAVDNNRYVYLRVWMRNSIVDIVMDSLPERSEQLALAHAPMSVHIHVHGHIRISPSSMSSNQSSLHSAERLHYAASVLDQSNNRVKVYRLRVALHFLVEYLLPSN